MRTSLFAWCFYSIGIAQGFFVRAHVLSPIESVMAGLFFGLLMGHIGHYIQND